MIFSFLFFRLVVSQNGRALHIVFPHQFLDSPEWFGVSTDEYFQVCIETKKKKKKITGSESAISSRRGISRGKRKRDSCGIVGLTEVIFKGSGVEWLGMWERFISDY